SRTMGTSRSAVMILRASVKYMECRCFAVSVSSSRARAHAGCLRGTNARMYGMTLTLTCHAPTSNSRAMRLFVAGQMLQCRAFLARESLALPHARRIHQHAPGPAINVVFLDRAPHQLHPLTPLVARHLHRGLDRSRGLGHVERIHQQRFEQLPRGSGEGA